MDELAVPLSGDHSSPPCRCAGDDAASHTGIDDVREIIDNARYRPVMARTKVYIIDKCTAFQGCIQRAVEDAGRAPEHVKFSFATTEIEKVPVTVRSRCQRFDLRRIERRCRRALRKICDLEK